MRISAVNIQQLANFKQINSTKLFKNIKTNNNPCSFRGNLQKNTNEFNTKLFTTVGGEFYFDSATVGEEKKPFTGIISQKNGSLDTKNTYVDGKKQEIKMTINSRRDFIAPHIILSPQKYTTYGNGSSKIRWINTQGTYVYDEFYTKEGKLSRTILTQYEQNYIPTETKFTHRGSFQKVTNNNVLARTTTEYYADGITPQKENIEITSDSSHSKYGYKKMTAIYSKSGHLLEETCTNKVTAFKTKTSEKEVKSYNPENGMLERIEESNIKYYEKESAKEPFATSTHRVTRLSGTSAVTTEHGYKILDKSIQDENLKAFCFEYHPNTVKQHKGNIITYYDGDTKKRYAIEKHDAETGKITQITNFERKTNTYIKEVKGRTIAKQYDKDKKLMSTAIFTKDTKGLVPIQIEEYYIGTAKVKTIKAISIDSKTQITEYDEDGNITERTKLNASGQTIAKASFENKKIKHQTVYNSDGSYREIEYNNEQQITEKKYRKDGSLQEETIYINRLAEEQKVYDTNGNLSAIKAFNKGICVEETDANGKIVRFEDEAV